MMEWVGGLGEAWGAPALTADAQQRAEVVVPALARRDWKQLRKGVAALPDQPPDSELHRIRILAKRVRYAAEAAEPIARKIATRTAEDAAALQDVLGGVAHALGQDANARSEEHTSELQSHLNLVC